MFKKAASLLLLALLLFASPPLARGAEKPMLEIKERLFATVCDDIYLNAKKYTGRKVKIEGFCLVERDPFSGKKLYGVFRKSPGCCGNDGLSGFEFTFDGKKPKENEWLEVIGKLELVETKNYSTIVIRAESVVVKNKRGASFVRN